MTKDSCKNKLIELYLRLYLERYDRKPIWWCWEGKNKIQVIDKHRVQHLHLIDVIFGVMGIL